MVKIKENKITLLALILLAVVFTFSNSAQAQRKSPKAGGLVNLDFQDADIKDVVKSISEITGKNFILDDRIRGKITIISPTPVTIDEAYEAFLSALEIKNFTVVPGSGRTLKLIPLREAKNSPITTISDMETPYGDTFITRLISIKYISASEIANSLKTLVSSNGNLLSYTPTNTLIMTDSASNIRRLMKIIGKLDKEGSVEGIEIIPLKYASAQEVAQKLMSIFPQQKESSLLQRALSARRGESEPAQALSISKIIPDDRTNSLIVVANRQGLERLLDIVKRLDIEVKAQEGKGRIHVHYLEHADAEELAATLSSLSGGGKPSTRKSRGSTPAQPSPMGGNVGQSSPGAATLEIFEGEIKIAPDIATNSLVITASGQDYESLKSVIAKLDIPRPQVFVEALIMEVTMRKQLSAGLAGNMGGNAMGPAGNQSAAFGATQLGGLSSLLFPSDPSALTGLALGLRSRTIPISVGGGKSIDLPIYGALFRAWQENSNFNIISTPNILTTDNKEAEVVVGEVVPVITQQQQGAVTGSNIVNQISREKVATTLKVTPQINESDFVAMDIYQEISEVKSISETLGPTTSTRSAKTTVVVQDSQTVVIGGLIKDKINKTVSKVPILGDIPLLGLLFRSTNSDVDKVNLMIFITPHIIHQPYDLQEVTVKQNERRKLFNRKNNIDEHPGIKDYGFDKSIDFNSQRPRKNRPVDSQSQPTKPAIDKDSTDDKNTKQKIEDNPIEIKPPDASDDKDQEGEKDDTAPSGLRQKQGQNNQFTQVDMRPPRKTKPSDASFFNEETTVNEPDDSDFISDDLLLRSPSTRGETKPKIDKGGESPFIEVAPPSSGQ